MLHVHVSITIFIVARLQNRVVFSPCFTGTTMNMHMYICKQQQPKLIVYV